MLNVNLVNSSFANRAVVTVSHHVVMVNGMEAKINPLQVI